MNLICDYIVKKRKEKQEVLLSNLPKEIICKKCDGPNPFENDICQFCGYVFDKSKYYDLEYYDELDQDDSQVDDKEGHAFQYIISFLIPLIGFILGAILLSKESEEERELGKACIILGIISIVISMLLWIII